MNVVLDQPDAIGAQLRRPAITQSCILLTPDNA